MLLKQLSMINAGYPFRGKIPKIAGGKVLVVQMKDILPAVGVQWQTCIATALASKSTSAWLKPNDILVAARGSRYYAVKVDDFMLRAGFSAVAAPHFFVLRLILKDVLPAYLAWFLNQAPCQRYFEQHAEGSFTKSIRRSVLEETPILLPSLAKQQKIINLVNVLNQQQHIVNQLQCHNECLIQAILNDLAKHTKESDDE